MKKVTIKACEVQPYKHAFFCSTEDREHPFWTACVFKNWVKGGLEVCLGLHTYEALFFAPEDLVEVGEFEESEISDGTRSRLELPENSVEFFMKQRPNPEKAAELVEEIKTHLPPSFPFEVRVLPVNSGCEIEVTARHGRLVVEVEEGDTPEQLAKLILDSVSDLSFAGRAEKSDRDRIEELEEQVQAIAQSSQA